MKKILVADDEANIRLLVRSTLEDEENWRILEAVDGAEVLDRIGTDAPDLLILDLMMPRVSGLDVLKKLKAKPPAHPPIVVVLTAKVSEERNARALGAQFFLKKPFSPLDLMKIVEQVLGQQVS